MCSVLLMTSILKNCYNRLSHCCLLAVSFSHQIESTVDSEEFFINNIAEDLVINPVFLHSKK